MLFHAQKREGVRRLAYDGSLTFDTKIDTSGFQKGVKKLGSMAKTGAKVVGTAVTAAGAAMAGLGAAAVKVGAEFETSMAKASTLFGDVQVDTANLNKKVLELSDSTGVAASQIGESLYNALSAGIPATKDMGDAMAYMESNAKLAKAGFTDIDTAVTATAKVLNAYKMDVSETDKIHKILMQTQNKGITTVGELGSVLAQVTPTASAMGVSFENVGAALATMTAQGTPTAQATTQLNSLLAELGKSGQQANKNLMAATAGTKYAGKGFQELMQEGVPLNEVLDLMDQHAQANGKSLLDMFGSIEAGKAALSLAGQNSAQFATNLAAMSTETDVVGEAYKKVTNTLEHNSKRIINSVKNIGIAFYQDVKSPLADVSGEIADMVDQLSNAFKNGGLDGLVKSLGDVLSQAVTKIATAAPKMIEAGKNLIKSFVSGITKNAKSIAKGAADIVKSLANAIVELAPVIYDAARELATELVRAFLGDEAAEALGEILETFGKLFGDIFQIVSGVFEAIVPIISGAATAIMAILGPVLKLIELVTGAIASTISSLHNADIDTPADKAISRTEEIQEKLENQKRTYDEMRVQQVKNVQQGLKEIEYTKKLASELDTLVDANGNVTDANKGRVNYILTSLNKAYGTEYKLIDGTIDGYKNIQKEIENIVAKQKWKIIEEANLPMFEEAIKKEAEQRKEQANAYADYAASATRLRDARIDLNKIEKELAEEKKRRDQGIEKMTADAYNEAINKRLELLETIGKEELAQEGLYTTYKGTTDALNQTLSDRDVYQEAMAAAEAGRYDEAVDLLTNHSNQYIQAAMDMSKSDEERRQNAGQAYAVSVYEMEQYLNRCKSGVENFNEETFSSLLQSAILAKETGEKIGVDFGDGTVTGIEGQEYRIGGVVESIASTVPDKFKAMIRSAGMLKNAVDVPNETKALEGQISSVAGGAIAGARESLKIDKNGASQITRDKIGKPMIDGTIQGILAGNDRLTKAFTSTTLGSVEWVRKQIQINSPSKLTRDKIGKPLIEGVAVGIKENSKEVSDAFQKALDDLELKREMDIINDDEYYQELKKLRDKHLEVGTKDWWDYTQKLIDLRQKALEKARDAVQDAFQELVNDAKNQIAEVDSLVERMAQKLSEYGGMYDLVEGTDRNGEEYSYMTLRDIDQDIEALEEYGRLMDELKGREGVTPEFIDAIAEMSVEEGTKFMQALLWSTEEDFNAYLEKWKKRNDLSKSIADDVYGDRYDEIGENFVEGINGQIDKLPPEFLENGKLCADMFEDGFLEGLKGLGDKLAAVVSDQVTASGVSAVIGQFGFTSGGGGASTTNKNVTVNYSFNGAGMTVAQQRRAAQAQAEIDRLRWG